MTPYPMITSVSRDLKTVGSVSIRGANSLTSSWQSLETANVTWEANRRSTQVGATGNEGRPIFRILTQARHIQE